MTPIQEAVLVLNALNNIFAPEGKFSISNDLRIHLHLDIARVLGRLVEIKE